MSEDWYFADDEENSAEIAMQGTIKPVSISSLAQQQPPADIDDIFEGEPDSSLFAPSDFDDTDAIFESAARDGAVATSDSDRPTHQPMHGFGPQKTCDDTGREGLHESNHTLRSASQSNYAPPTVESEQSSTGSRDGLNAVERPQSIFTASGGLGAGDPPYNQMAPSRKSDNLQLPTWQHGPQVPDSWSPRVRARNALRKRYEHLEELSGETSCRENHENYRYSSSASSELLSDDGPRRRVQRGSEEDGSNAASKTPPFLRPHLQTESKWTLSAQQSKAQPKSQDNDQDGSIIESSSTWSTHSSLPRSWPHLSEVTPACVQGHHPSIISRSPRKGMSRASSLASEGGLDALEQLQPLTEAALRETDILSGADALKNFHNSFSFMKVEPHPPMFANNSLSSPFRRPDTKRSTSSSRSSPLRRPADPSDAVSTLAVTESPMPLPSAVPSRPDAPRPNAELEKPDAFDHQHFQPFSAGIFSSDPDSVPSCNVRRLAAQNGSWSAPGSVPQLGGGTTRVATSPSLSSGKLQQIGDSSPQLKAPWQEPRPIPDVLENRPPRAQSKDSSTASLHSDASAYPRTTPREPTATVRELSDLLPQDNGPVGSARSPGGNPVFISPLVGLHDAIKAKRGSRKATTPKRRPIKDPIGTRGRAVSLSPMKQMTSTTGNNAPAIGVQGQCIKVTKTRSRTPARNTSRKATLRKDKSMGVVDDMPRVPDLPDAILLESSGPGLHSNQLLSEYRSNSPDVPVVEGLSSPQEVPSRSGTATNGRNDNEEDSPQALFEGLVTAPGTHKQKLILRVPKTRDLDRSTKMPSRPYQTNLTTTETLENPEHNRMEIDSISHDGEPDTSRKGTQNPNQQTEPTTPSRKKRLAIRKHTPGGIQKATIRKSKTPARLPTHKSAQMADLLETGGHPKQPEKLTWTPPTNAKPKAASRKAIPSPRKRKQDKDVLDEDIPPWPVTPKRTDKNDGAKDGGRLTPQSAARGEPKTPLRRSPRLSGVEPGQSLSRGEWWSRP